MSIFRELFFWKMAKKNFHDFRRKEKDVNENEYVMKVLAFFLNIWSLPIS